MSPRTNLHNVACIEISHVVTHDGAAWREIVVTDSAGETYTLVCFPPESQRTEICVEDELYAPKMDEMDAN